MRILREWLWRLRAALYMRSDDDLTAELEFHRQMAVEDAQRQGRDPREALMRAGTVSLAAELVRDQRGPGPFSGFGADLRQAATALRRHCGYSAIAICALSLSVATATLMFSLFHGLVLKGLPYPAAARLISVYDSSERNPKFPMSIGNYQEYARENRTLEGLALFTGVDVAVMHDGRPERVSAVRVTHEFFPLLGVMPVLGRNFQKAELHRNARVVILSHRYWTARYHGDPGVLGASIMVDREPWTVIGVLPSDFQHVGGSYRTPLHGDTVPIWFPARLDLPASGIRGWHFHNAIARVKAEFSLEQAQADLLRISNDLARRYPDSNRGFRALVAPLDEELRGGSTRVVSLLMAAGAIVLLIAAANLASLSIARGLARRREIGVRQALGASQWRLVRVVLAENVVVGMAGGMAGVALAYAVFPALRTIVPEDFPRLHEMALGWAEALFAVSAALTVSLFSGLATSLRSMRQDPVPALTEGGRGASATREATKLRGALVVGEVALAALLGSTAILLVRSAWQLDQRPHGFDARNVLTFQLALNPNKYSEAASLQFFRGLIQRIEQLPGVRSAGFTTGLPWTGYDENSGFEIVGRPARPGESMQARFQSATPGYFAAMRIPLKDGRHFEDRDHETAPPVVLVNEAFAKRYFPGTRAIGQRLDLWGKKREIVGVVADIQDRPAEAGAEPAFWWPLSQVPFPSFTAVLRTESDPALLTSAVEHVVHEVDRELPVAAVRTMDRVAASALAERRFTMWLIQCFAMLALGLAAFGLYGLLNYITQQRRREIAIRLAMGANASQVGGLLVRHGLGLSLAGAAIAAMLTPIAGMALKPFLYGVTASDPLSILTPMAILFAGVAASAGPAIAAARSRPIDSLRQD